MKRIVGAAILAVAAFGGAGALDDNTVRDDSDNGFRYNDRRTLNYVEPGKYILRVTDLDLRSGANTKILLEHGVQFNPSEKLFATYYMHSTSRIRWEKVTLDNAIRKCESACETWRFYLGFAFRNITARSPE